MQNCLQPIFVASTQPFDDSEIFRFKIAQFHIGYENGLGALKVKTNVKTGEGLKPFNRVLAFWLSLPSAQKLIHMRAHQIEQQALFVLGIEIQGPRLHPDLGGNFAHRDRGKTMPGKELQRRALDQRAGDFRM